MTLPVRAGPTPGGTGTPSPANGRAVLGITARRAGTVAMYGFLLAAVAYFAWRGVWRGVFDSGDLAVGFAAGRAWLAGLNPYDVGVLKEQMILADGAEFASSTFLDQLRNVYVPGTLPTFAILAVASWPIAKLVFVAANVAGSVFIALGLQRLLGWPPSRRRALVLAGFILALAPIHTTIASGQTAILSVACVLAAVLLGQSGRPVLSGTFYGLATLAKFQIGLPFIGYLLVRRRWLAAAIAGIVIGGGNVLAIGRMQAASVPWLESWLANLTALSGPGGINDPDSLNPERYSLINLQFLLFSLSPSGEWIDLFTFGVVGALAMILIRAMGTRDLDELLPISVIAVLTLLVAYHRYYDAVLLVFPGAWAVAALRGRHRREGLIVLLLAADFALPFQTAFHDFQRAGRLPTWISDGLLWNTVLLTQHVWALVLMAGVLLVAVARSRVKVGESLPSAIGP